MLAEILRQSRRVHPLVHCISNHVTSNDCANLLLAIGASPIMADDPEESAEITALCSGLVLNLGTPSPRKIEAMLLSGRTANALNLPVVLDPVGVGSSQLRRGAALHILENIRLSAIRGNASEIRTLAEGTKAHRGVDADEDENASLHHARLLARKTGAVVLRTGAEDIVTDGHTLYRVQNGCPMMKTVTGAGCQLSALTGAYAAANPENMLAAVLAAGCAMGLCGEIAHRRLRPGDGNASYRNYIIDALFSLTPEQLEEEARYETE